MARLTRKHEHQLGLALADLGELASLRKRWCWFAYGRPGLRRSAALWGVLRERSYVRQSLAVARSALTRWTDDAERRRILHRLQDSGRRWEELLQTETLEGLLDPDEFVGLLHHQLTERNIRGRTQELVSVAEERPWVLPLVPEDDIEELAEVIRLRNECRAVTHEAADLLPELREEGSWGQYYDDVDEELAELIRRNDLAWNIAKNLRLRYYDLDSRAEVPGMPWFGDLPPLTTEDLPWLTGKREDPNRRRPWWV